MSCGGKDNATKPQTDYLFAFSDDSCRCINYMDEYIFTNSFTDASLFYNGFALIQDKDGNWGYIDRKGMPALPAVYEKATVFSEGLAWVSKKGDMPGAINDKGEVKVSLRKTKEVRVFQEGRAAFSTFKKNYYFWGYLDKNGNEIITAQFRAVRDFRLGLAAVQDNVEGKWGYINLLGELVIPYQYQEAHSFNDEGYALIKANDRYFAIDRKGTLIHEFQHERMIPDGSIYMICNNGYWGWCDASGKTFIECVYEDVKPFGNARLAPVRIAGKWAYISKEGNIVIKRQFTDAYPFVGDLAAVQTGIMWGFVNDKGVYAINPQYDAISQDYLNQAVGQGSVFTTLHIDTQ